MTIFKGKKRVITDRRIIPPPIPVTAEIAAVKKEKAIRKIGTSMGQVIIFIQIFCDHLKVYQKIFFSLR